MQVDREEEKIKENDQHIVEHILMIVSIHGFHAIATEFSTGLEPRSHTICMCICTQPQAHNLLDVYTLRRCACASCECAKNVQLGRERELARATGTACCMLRHVHANVHGPAIHFAITQKSWISLYIFNFPRWHDANACALVAAKPAVTRAERCDVRTKLLSNPNHRTHQFEHSEP